MTEKDPLDPPVGPYTPKPVSKSPSTQPPTNPPNQGSGAITKEDPINPKHYKSASGLESIDVIEAFGLQNNLYLAAAVQYILRAGKKQDRTAHQDIEKAIWYLERFNKSHSKDDH